MIEKLINFLIILVNVKTVFFVVLPKIVKLCRQGKSSLALRLFDEAFNVALNIDRSVYDRAEQEANRIRDLHFNHGYGRKTQAFYLLEELEQFRGEMDGKTFGFFVGYFSTKLSRRR